MADDPVWLAQVLERFPVETTRERHMQLAVALATTGAECGGGPFGAVVVDGQGRRVAAGWNRVVETCDSTAHAEVVALRRAQAALGTHDLAGHADAPFTLHASAEPCIQCFGAIYWSGLRHVYASADKAEAEAVGFDEGPIDLALWARAFAEKGIVFEPGFGDPARASEPFRAFRARGGTLY